MKGYPISTHFERYLNSHKTDISFIDVISVKYLKLWKMAYLISTVNMGQHSIFVNFGPISQI